MKQKITMDILQQVDEATEERIAEEFPANWEKEEIFERAYQNYLEQSQDEYTPAPIRHTRMMRIVSAASCCMLVLGAAYAMRVPMHQIPSVPDETVTETKSSTSSTEHPETTIAAIADTEPSSAASQSQPEAFVTSVETAPVPAITTTAMAGSDEFVQPDMTNPPIQTKPVTTPETADRTEPTHPQTTVRTTVQTSDILDSPKPTETYPETASPHTTQTQAPVIPTESPETAPEEPIPQEPVTPTEEYQTEAPVLDEPSALPGFKIRKQDGYLEIIYLEQVAPSPDALLYYASDSELVQIKEIFGIEAPVPEFMYYNIWLPEEACRMMVIQYRRDVFSQKCDENALLLPADVKGNPAYYVVESYQQTKTICRLYWDDGYYTFEITTNSVQNLELMKRVAEAFIYKEESS